MKRNYQQYGLFAISDSDNIALGDSVEDWSRLFNAAIKQHLAGKYEKAFDTYCGAAIVSRHCGHSYSWSTAMVRAAGCACHLGNNQLSLEMLIDAYENNKKSFYDNMGNGYIELVTYLSDAGYPFPYDAEGKENESTTSP
jgi:hypothetical protein